MCLRSWAWGGDPETFFAAALFVGLYMFARRLRDRRWAHLRLAVAGLCIAVVFALGLCAIQVVPFIEFQDQGTLKPLLDQVGLRLSHITALIAPHWTPPGEGGASRHIAMIHVGLVSLLLLPLWFSIRGFVGKALRRRVEALCMAALALFLIPFAVGRHWIPVPYLELLGPQHFLIIHPFALAFLVAAGGGGME